MYVRDLINNDFDCNCNFKIYDCFKDDVTWNDGASCIYDTANAKSEPSMDILCMKIQYITISDRCLIIEATY